MTAAVSARCTDCDRRIAGTSKDPIHAISGAILCAGCLRTRAHSPHYQVERKPSQGRANAAKARWAAMTPEQKAERVAKLIAGRKAQAGGAS